MVNEMCQSWLIMTLVDDPHCEDGVRAEGLQRF